MFPVTITLHNPAQLNAVLAAMGTDAPAPAVTAAEVRQHAEANQTTMKDAKATVQKEKAEAKKPEAKAQPAKDAAQSSAPTQTAADNSTSSSSGTDASETPEATYEDAKTAVLTLSKEKGRDAAKGALQRFGVEKLPDLAPEHFGALVALVDEVLAGAEV